MEVEFIPSVAQGEKPDFEGSVSLIPPSFDQRYEYIEKCAFKLDSKGDIAPDSSNIAAIRKMVSLSRKHIKSVSLVYKADDTRFDSYDSMLRDPICDPVLMEIAGALLKGVRPGKNSRS